MPPAVCLFRTDLDEDHRGGCSQATYTVVVRVRRSGTLILIVSIARSSRVAAGVTARGERVAKLSRVPGARFSVQDLTRCWIVFLALAHRTTCRLSSCSLQSMKSYRTTKYTYFLPRSCLLRHQFRRTHPGDSGILRSSC